MLSRGFASAMEVSRLLGIHVTNVYRLAQNGHVKAVRVGPAWYIELDSLATYARRHGPALTDVQLLARIEVLKKEGRALAGRGATA